MARLSMMYQKSKGLAMNDGNLAKIYIIENKIVIISSAARFLEKKGSSAESVGRLWFR
jgi:hypothetical protein